MALQVTTIQDEMEPFVVNNSNIIEVADEDLLDQFNDDESDDIYQLLCYARFTLLRKFIAPFIILLYTLQSFIYIIPLLDSNNIIFKLIILIPITLTFISYFKASLSSPGRIPKQWLLWNGQLNEIPPYPIYCRLHESVNLNNNDRLKASVLCRWCNKYRPFRTGHCSKCDKCIVHMCHHCEFIQNCVGAYNHRFFLQFIIYLFVILSLYLYYTHSIMYEIEEHKTMIITSFFFALTIYCWLIYRLLIPQIHQLFINQVYIERKFQTFKHVENYFETNSMYKNFEIIMGSSIIGWFLPLEWTKYDLKQRLIDTGYKSFDLLNGAVQLRDAVDQYMTIKLNDNKKKQHR